MKLHVEVEFGVDQAIKVLTESDGLSKEQSMELYRKTGGVIRPMDDIPFTVDEAISTISSVLIGGSSDNLLSEAQQLSLYKGLADNPRALTELALMAWDNKDVLEFLRTKFCSTVMQDKQTLLDNIKLFLDNEM